MKVNIGTFVRTQLSLSNITALSSAKVSILKHIIELGIQCPKVSFSGFAFFSVHFEKTIVEGQIMADTVLPALFIVVIIGKLVHDELVDTVQGYLLVRHRPNCHCDQCYIRVWRFLVRTI